MNEEAGFLEAIVADPDDEVARLVYADWLEEKGDPRSVVIRKLAELSHLAASDPGRPRLESSTRAHIALFGNPFWQVPIGCARILPPNQEKRQYRLEGRLRSTIELRPRGMRPDLVAVDGQSIARQAGIYGDFDYRFSVTGPLGIEDLRLEVYLRGGQNRLIRLVHCSRLIFEEGE